MLLGLFFPFLPHNLHDLTHKYVLTGAKKLLELTSYAVYGFLRENENEEEREFKRTGQLVLALGPERSGHASVGFGQPDRILPQCNLLDRPYKRWSHLLRLHGGSMVR